MPIKYVDVKTLQSFVDALKKLKFKKVRVSKFAYCLLYVKEFEGKDPHTVEVELALTELNKYVYHRVCRHTSRTLKNGDIITNGIVPIKFNDVPSMLKAIQKVA